MMISELIELFLLDRKQGGTRKKCSPKTLRIYADNLRVFSSHFAAEGVLKYEDLQRLKLANFCASLDAKGWADASIYQVKRTVRTFFIWCSEDEDLLDEQGRPLRNWKKALGSIPLNPRRLDIPENAVLKKFKNTFDTHDRWEYRDFIITCLLMVNGMRLGEVCNLEMRNVQWSDRILHVNGKKGDRSVPVTPEFLGMLRGWVKMRAGCKYAEDSPYVFVSKRAPKLDVSAMGNAFRKHCKKHGLPRITAHTFRHSFCTHYLAKGGSLAKLMNVTGHETVAQLIAYTHLADLKSKVAQDDLEKFNLLKEC